MAKKKKRNEDLKKPETAVSEAVLPEAESAPAVDAAEEAALELVNAALEADAATEIAPAAPEAAEKPIAEPEAESAPVEEESAPAEETVSAESASGAEPFPAEEPAPEECVDAEEAPFDKSASEQASEEAEPVEDTNVYELREEKNPELEPVIVERNPDAPIQFSRNIEREKKIAAEVRKRRRRPMVVVLCLCVLLVLAAIVVNAIDSGEFRLPGKTNREMSSKDTAAPAVTMIVVPTAPPVEETPAPTEAPVVESTYEIVFSNLSWEASAQEAIDKGGHLATISSYEELLKITTMAEEQGLYMLWIGCCRRGGSLVWENGEIIDYYAWGAGEPSTIDTYDGASEDYVMLWYNNGAWCYNDSRNDPAAYYPDAYIGKLGYVLEIEG